MIRGRELAAMREMELQGARKPLKRTTVPTLTMEHAFGHRQFFDAIRGAAFPDSYCTSCRCGPVYHSLALQLDGYGHDLVCREHGSVCCAVNDPRLDGPMSEVLNTWMKQWRPG